jgi:hypothetical protein
MMSQTPAAVMRSQTPAAGMMSHSQNQSRLCLLQGKIQDKLLHNQV